MTSADFSPYNQCKRRPPPVRALSFLQCLRHLLIYPLFFFFGRYKPRVAYPDKSASYAVSVRQYRILQSRFLQCLPRGKPPCDLLMLRILPAHKGLSPSGKIHLLHLLCFSEFICIFAAFSELAQQVRAAHAGRTSVIKIYKHILYYSRLSLPLSAKILML